jgi:hypothetical protein
MIKSVAVFILSLFLLSPMAAFCGWDGKAALWAYFDALSKGNVKQLDSLLSTGFEYHFYVNDKLNKLNRNGELKSLEKLLKNLSSNSFDLPYLFAQDVNDENNIHIKLTVAFEDSPKVYTDSFFRGAMLDIDETLIATVDDDHKISKIVETKDAGGKNKLSFGYLKAIHLKELETKSKDTNGPVIEGGSVEGDLISELLDKNSHELLLTSIQKKSKLGGGIVEIYYWPNKRPIENLHP